MLFCGTAQLLQKVYISSFQAVLCSSLNIIIIEATINNHHHNRWYI